LGVSWISDEEVMAELSFSAFGQRLRATGLQRFYASIGVSESQS
jgi:hypothetical protein